MPKRSEFHLQLEEIRQRLFAMLASLADAGVDPGGESEEAQMRQLLWVCVRELDSFLTESPPDVNLTAADAATQQRLYEFVVGVHFTPILLNDPGDIFIPPHTPEEAGLRVYRENGLWFATWMKLDEGSNLPEAESRELAVIERDEARGLLLRDV